MTTRGRKVWTAAVALAALGVFFWACGGKAVIDGEPSSGNGGASSNNSVNSNGSTSPLCQTPDPEGNLSSCPSSAIAGSGTFTCVTALCDEGGNVWQSDCTDDTCTCLYNAQVECTCFLDNGTFCSGTPSCCPAPFPD